MTPPEPPPTPAAGAPGAGLRQASWWGTGVFAATAAIAASAPDLGVLTAVAFAVSVALFLAGCVAFFGAYFKGERPVATLDSSVSQAFSFVQ